MSGVGTRRSSAGSNGGSRRDGFWAAARRTGYVLVWMRNERVCSNPFQILSGAEVASAAGGFIRSVIWIRSDGGG